MAGAPTTAGRFWREIRLLALTLLVGFAALAVVGVAYGLAFARRQGELQAAFKNAASVELTALILVAYSVMAAFILWRITPATGLSLGELGLRGLRARDWRTIGVGLVAILGANVAYQFMLNATGNAHHQQAGFEHVQVRSAIGGVLFVASTALIAPFTEELIFRMLLFRTLAQKMPWLIAAVVSAAAFGGAHGDIVIFPVLAWMGFVNAVAYRRSGNIVTSMVLHGVNNVLAAAALL
jgi:membrane protease YdiL (CAAX protease family)